MKLSAMSGHLNYYNMRKRNYILTPCDYGYKVEAWDDYGKYTCVYEKTREDASDFVMNWWQKSEENKKKDTLWREAMTKMIKNDVVTGNRDGLD
jgi:hypothetical protein|tara:strand:- start:219 stop:500 length:282 start_codon:yes stop_codon:yes gene_type:complete